jgi:hypothetical protein
MDASIKVSRTQRTTYLSVPANVTDYNKQLVNRAVLVEWLADAKGQPVEHPAGTFVATHYHGKGHKTQKLDQLVTIDRAAAEAWIDARLAGE